MDAVDVSVIICSRDRPILLEGAVQSILSGSRIPLEIIVVDQSDAVNNELAGSGVTEQIRYIWSRVKGAGHARNMGIRLARGSMLAFIDDDVAVHHDWLINLTEKLSRVGARGVVTGRVCDRAAGEDDVFAPSTHDDQHAHVFSGTVHEDILYTGNMALFRSAIYHVGMFDERLGPGTAFPAAEDNDFGLRLLRAGYQVYYVPDASVDHLAWRKQSDYLPLRWRYGKGQGGFYGKHLSLSEPVIAGRFIRDVTRPFISSVVRFWRKDRFGGVFFSVGVGIGCIQWLARERLRSSKDGGGHSAYAPTGNANDD